MAHNALVRSGLAAWQADPIVVALEFRKLDLACYESINGDQGGTWAPVLVITVGGAGLTVSGQFRATDVRNILVNAAGAFACNADAEFNGLLDVTSTGSFHVAAGASYSIEADGEFLGEIDFADKLRMNTGAFLTIQSGASLTIDVGATLSINTTLTMANDFVRSGGNGRAKISGRALKSTNLNQTVGVELDYVEMNVTGAGAIILTLKIATAPTPTEGEKIFVRKIGAGAGGLVIQNEGSAANIVTVAGANLANFMFMFETTTNKWRLFSGIGTFSQGADAV